MALIFLGREEDKSGRTESEKSWWMSNWLVWPIIIPNPKDVYGNYCGACRINGKYFDGEGQHGWKSEEIGEGRTYHYYDRTGEKKIAVAPPPKDDYDRCCMDHDRCLADVEHLNATQAEKSKQTKICDERLSWCWLKAYVGWNSAIVARIKPTSAIPVMAIAVHPGDTANVVSDILTFPK